MVKLELYNGEKLCIVLAYISKHSVTLQSFYKL